MPIQVTCENCFHDHTVKSEYAGRKFKCKGCGEPLQVPNAKSRSRSRKPDDDDFLGALDAAAGDRGRELPPAPAARKRSAGKASSPKKSSSGGGMDDSHKKAIVGGIGTVLLLLLAVGLKLVNRTDIVDRMLPSSVSWQQFQLNDGALTVDMPGTPKAKIEPLPEGIVEQQQFYADAKDFGCSITAGKVDASGIEDWQKRMFRIDVLKGQILIDQMQNPLTRTRISDELIELHGIRTLHTVTEGVDAEHDNRKVRANAYFFMAGPSLYVLVFVEEANRPKEDEHQHFLDSIVISDRVLNEYKEWQGQWDANTPASQLAANDAADPEAEPVVPSDPSVDLAAQGNSAAASTEDSAMNGTSPMTEPVAATTPDSSQPKPEPVVPSEPEEIEWTIAPDPLPDIPTWTMASKIAIDLPNGTDEVIVPNLYGSEIFVTPSSIEVSGTVRLDLKTGKTEKTFAGTARSPKDLQFSPNGKRFLFRQIKSNVIDIWDFDRSRVATQLHIPEIETKSTDPVNQVAFVDDDHVVVFQHIDKKESNVYLFDLATEAERHEPVQTATVEGFTLMGSVVTSPGGKYLAGESWTSNEVRLWDWEQNRWGGQLKFPKSSQSGRSYALEGIAFKPDGSEVTVVVESTADRVGIFSFSMNDGSMLWEHHYDSELDQLVAGADFFDNRDYVHNLRWSWDGSAYLLAGKYLVDVASQNVLWTINSFPDDKFVNLHNNRTFHLTSRGVLSIESDDYRRQLQLKPFDLGMMQESLALLEKPDEYMLGPGTEVTLEVAVDSVHVGSKDEIQAQLEELWTDKLESLGFVVKDGASFKLHYDYRDLKAADLTERSTNKTIPSTAIQARIQWLQRSSKKALWEFEKQFELRLVFLDKEGSAESVREKTIEEYLAELKQQSIPYLIPKDKELPMLPQFARTAY